MDHALTRRIGMRLRSARQARGLSMKQVSQLTGGRLGVSRIANFENGTRRPSIESAVMLAAALGNIPVPELLCLGVSLRRYGLTRHACCTGSARSIRGNAGIS